MRIGVTGGVRGDGWDWLWGLVQRFRFTFEIGARSCEIGERSGETGRDRCEIGARSVRGRARSHLVQLALALEYIRAEDGEPIDRQTTSGASSTLGMAEAGGEGHGEPPRGGGGAPGGAGAAWAFGWSREAEGGRRPRAGRGRRVFSTSAEGQRVLGVVRQQRLEELPAECN